MSSRPRRLWLLPLAVLVLVGPPPSVTVAAVLAAVAIELTVRLRQALADVGAVERAAAAAGPQLPLGVDPGGRQVTLSDQALSAHALILGASGAGKSTTLLTVLGEHIRRGGPAIAIDLKGSPSFAAAIERACAEAGRPLRCWTPDGTDHWNPLAHGNPTELKDKLICTERFTEPHYQRAAERYLQTVMQVLEAAHPDRPPVLGEVVAALDSQRMRSLLEQVPGPMAARVEDYLAGLGRDQWSAVRGIATRLAIISESHTGIYLEPGPGRMLDLCDALTGREVVLFSLNSSAYGRLASQLGTLAVQDLVTTVGHRLRDGGGPHALVALDEFSALGADNVVALLARGREAGVSVLLATQELADLDRAAPGLRDQVLGNTAVKIVHRQDVPSSARVLSAMIGAERVWEETRHTGQSILFGRRDTGRGTRREVERPIVHPDEIERLGTGQAVLLTKIPTAATTHVRITPPPARGAER